MELGGAMEYAVLWHTGDYSPRVEEVHCGLDAALSLAILVGGIVLDEQDAIVADYTATARDG